MSGTRSERDAQRRHPLPPRLHSRNSQFRNVFAPGSGSGYGQAQLTTVKDVQAHLRHTNAKTTLEHYIKSVPESVRVAVESLDQLLKKTPSGSGKQAN